MDDNKILIIAGLSAWDRNPSAQCGKWAIQLLCKEEKITVND